jgi:hypothetical protein
VSNPQKEMKNEGGDPSAEIEDEDDDEYEDEKRR